MKNRTKYFPSQSAFEQHSCRQKILNASNEFGDLFRSFRFVVVCGDGEYIIYTAMALRNKSFGSAQEFVWAQDASVYAIREGSSMVKIFKNFKEVKSFKPDFGAEGEFYIFSDLRFLRKARLIE